MMSRRGERRQVAGVVNGPISSTGFLMPRSRRVTASSSFTTAKPAISARGSSRRATVAHAKAVAVVLDDGEDRPLAGDAGDLADVVREVGRVDFDPRVEALGGGVAGLGLLGREWARQQSRSDRRKGGGGEERSALHRGHVTPGDGRAALAAREPRATIPVPPSASPSSRGLGRGPFKAKTRVRIPVGTPSLKSQWQECLPLLRPIGLCALASILAGASRVTSRVESRLVPYAEQHSRRVPFGDDSACRMRVPYPAPAEEPPTLAWPDSLIAMGRLLPPLDTPAAGQGERARAVLIDRSARSGWT